MNCKFIQLHLLLYFIIEQMWTIDLKCQKLILVCFIVLLVYCKMTELQTYCIYVFFFFVGVYLEYLG